jgi:methylated-DNA-[protein]-cysteine S-methyltransferase
MPRSDPDRLVVFRTQLGWMAILGAGEVLKQLTFGHVSGRRAMAHLAPALASSAQRGPWNPQIVERLQAYADGAKDDFLDVKVDLCAGTDFQRRVLACCRRIPWGHTMTYADLAARAGFPGAARAVGRAMASNRVPLVIPCHRVIGADGSLRGFSGSGGVRMKRRLLALEAGSLGSRVEAAGVGVAT